MLFILLRLGVGLGAAAFIGFVAKRLGWLTTGGAVAATFVGGAIFAFTGWQGACVLILFFVSSSLLSRLNPGGQGADNKGGPRNARQVLANGLVASLAALWAGVSWEGLFPLAGVMSDPVGDPVWPRMALAGALAAATADTWATEIGMWAKGVPRSALTARVVAPGESGGMTAYGTFGGLVGAAVIGTASAWAWEDFGAAHAMAIEVAGFAGMWLDSLLGAGVQYQAYCPTCERTVEDPRHGSLHGHPVRRRRGFRFVDNDVVNLLATLAGAVVAAIVGG